VRVLAINGSLRRGSHNGRLIRAAALSLPPGAELVRWERLREIPPFSEDDEADPQPEAVVALKRAIRGADAVLFSTPEYNHSLPGQLKNALDWVSRPFPDNPLMGRPAAVVGASTSLFGAVWAQAELRRVLGAIGARVVDRELPVAQAGEDTFAADGRLADPDQRVLLGEVLVELAAAAGPADAGADEDGRAVRAA